MAMIGKVKRMYFREKKSVREIVRLTSLSRNTVRKHLFDTDWDGIAAAFEAHDDARFGDLPSAEFPPALQAHCGPGRLKRR